MTHTPPSDVAADTGIARNIEPPQMPAAPNPAAQSDSGTRPADETGPVDQTPADAVHTDEVHAAEAHAAELHAVEVHAKHAHADEVHTDEEPLQPDWQALPARAHRVFRYVALITAAVPAGIVSLVLYNRFDEHPAIWLGVGGVFATAVALALWFAYRRYRYTFWKLDRDGFAVKRGRVWQWETRVPTTRVQHMDLKRGPLERAHGLASVILHTAGTRLSAVGVSGMDHHDAERLRDYLSRQIDRQDGDEHEHP